jgi:hypothetical protein
MMVGQSKSQFLHLIAANPTEMAEQKRYVRHCRGGGWMESDTDVRQDLLERIRIHQTTINSYVRKKRGRRELTTNISVVSSAIAATLTLGPALGGEKFSQVVQNGFGWNSDSGVYRLLCFAALVVNLVTAISTALNKTNDYTEQIKQAEASGAALEGLLADVEFGNLAVRAATAEYKQIIARVQFIVGNSAADRDIPRGEAEISSSPRMVGWFRRSMEIIIPSMTLAFGSLVIAFVLVGLGRGIAVAGP